jgi:amino acid adenylation domain-containing protein/non-ribosomal peptide synthase protein (TIGR01720 family)
MRQLQNDRDLLECLLAEEGIELSPASVIPVRRNQREAPLSFAQQRLWALHQMYPAAASAYNIVVAVRLSGLLNVTAFEASLNEVVRRHEVLRSCFDTLDGQARLRILPSLKLEIPVLDLRGQPGHAQDEILRRKLEEETLYHFDLEHGPLVRVALQKVSDTEHAALLNLHHLVADAWSMGVLISELGQTYRALIAGKPSPLAELDVQHSDFAEWQRSQLEEGHLDSQLAYWKKQLTGAAPLDLPVDRTSRERTFRGAAHTFLLPQSLASALKKLGQEEGATLFMTLLAAYQVLLYRHTSQTDISVGTPVANRNRREIEPLIGFFVNTLVLRSDLSGQPSFRVLLRQVRDVALAAYSNQDVPFEKLVQELMPDREPGRNPLFQVMFSLENRPGGDLHFPGLSVSPIPVEMRVSKFDLTLSLSETDAGLAGGFDYSTDVFDAETIARMADHFRVLLAAVIADPDQAITALPILPDPERTRVLIEWNQTASDYPREESIIQVFEHQAERSPHATAIEFGTKRLTYQELNTTANRLAHRLRDLGVQAEDRIGISVNPSAEMVIGLLGILKAGGTYVPLSPTDPTVRLEKIIAEAQLRLIVTEEALLAVLPASPIQRLCLDRDWPLAQHSSPDNPSAVSAGDSLAYVIYTSGSTGEPKGIAVPHRAVLRLVLNTNYVALNPADRIAQASNFTFDAITFEVWGALLNGACLVGVSRDIALAPTQFSRFLADKQITTLFLTTALFNEIARTDRTAFSSLTHLLFGGEAVDPRCVEDVLKERSPRRLLHVYGPTESTTFATWFLVEEVPPFSTTVPIGRPISNTEAYVLDASLKPLPIGVPGELYLGGDGLARGYFGQPEVTAEKFRPHPFSDRPGVRLYKTGDWVRTRPTGDIEFLGRIDEQVKIRGFRIELGDVESALLRHPDVMQVAVLARSDESGQRRLVAYIVIKPDSPCGNIQLRSHLREMLPDYMIPAQFTRLASMPLNANGKVDRKELPAPERSVETGKVYEPPRSEPEQILASIWERVLGVQRVGITDNYLELGGDSIRAIQIVSRFRSSGWQLKADDIIRRPTIAELSPHMRRLVAEPERITISGPVPLTPIQRWYFEQHAGDLHHFNQAVLLRARERLDEMLLRAALLNLQEHHDALRMTYRTIGNSVEQVNSAANHPLSFEVLDLRKQPDEALHLEAHANALQAGLSLEQGPLMKAALYRLTEGDRLLLVIHHLVVDLLSWRILLEDLEQGYIQRLRGMTIETDPESHSFKSWAEEVARFSVHPDLLSEIKYWSSRKAAESNASAPVSRSLFGDSLSAQTRLSEEETRNLLTGVHHAYNTEVNDILLTALGRALKRWHGGDQTWVTLEGHGREPLSKPLDLGRTVGWFTSLYPFLLETPGDDPGTQIRHVKESLRQVPRKGVGYGILKYLTPPELKPEFDDSTQISFNYGGQFGDGGGDGLFTFAAESSGQPISPRLQRRHEVDIGGMVIGGRLELSIIFDPKRHRPETADTLLAGFKTELILLAEHCRQRKESEKTPSDFGTRVFSLNNYQAFLESHGWQPSQIEDIYALSPMQQGLLFEALFDPNSRAYFIQTSCRLEGTLDADIFERSWREVCRRHTALRTGFVQENVPHPLQVVFKVRDPEIKVEDLRGLNETEQQARLSECQLRERERPFDFEHDPLIRITLLKFADTTSQVVWTYPHIILDGWCIGIVYKDFLQTYQALSNGENPQLPPAPAYRDYIGWLEKQDADAARSYWARYLAGYEQGTTVPRLTRPSQPSASVPRTRIINLSVATCTRVKQVASDLGVTVSTFMQTAWGLVLSRYNDARDIVFGQIVSGRPSELPGVEETVGLFINAIPVRIHFGPNQSVSDVLQSLQLSSLESEPYQHLPLAEIQAQSPIGRGLFDHLLIFENYPVAEDLNWSGISARPELSVKSLDAHDRTHYDLDLVVVPGEQIQLQISYNASVYHDEQIERTGAHLEAAINGLIQDPRRAIDDVEILPDWEQKQITSQFNNSARSYPCGATITELFEEQVRRTPHEVAVTFQDVSLTYAELSAKADRLANCLVHLGVEPEVLVGICVERSVDMIVGLLGILKAGGAYLPLDPLFPEERLAFMFNDANPPVLLTQKTLLGKLRPGNMQVILLDEDWDAISRYQRRDSPKRASPGNLAYVIYTSGTTGRAKGVMIEHRSLVNGAYMWKEYYELESLPVRILQLAAFSSDVFTGDFIRSFTNGGQLIICPSDVRPDPVSLYELMAKHRITIFESTPALIIPLMEYIYENGLDHSFLKLLITGSDTVPAAQYRKLVSRFGANMRVVNSYGLTEASIDSSNFEDRSGDAICYWSAHTPIGQPLPNTRYYVRDTGGRILPIGVPGELYIGGVGLARGYLNREALTAERFVPDPSNRGERLYKSGDVVRWLPDGNIEFLGRNDDQVKIRGYRVELKEVEHCLSEHPTVKQAVARLKDFGGGDRELVAYVVLSKLGQLEPRNWRQQIRAFVSERLPDYMVPAYIVDLEALPQTALGKIDTAGLPDPGEQHNAFRGALHHSAEPPDGNQQPALIPLSEQYQSIIRIWQDVLRTRTIGPDDDFFLLGGHSLKAMQIVSRIHKQLGVRVPLRDFFARPTVSGIVSLVKAARHSAYSGIEPAPKMDYYDLSHGQHRLWLLHQVGGAAAYNMAEAHTFETGLDVAALKKAFSTIIQRHEILRTAFVVVDGEPKQKILSHVNFEIQEIELSTVENPSERAREMMNRELSLPFQLEQPPLLRATLVRLGGSRHLFFLVTHHIIGDGWSSVVFYREILSLYEAYRVGLPNPLKELRIQYSDFVFWQHAKSFEREESYWRNKLTPLPETLRLPYDMRSQDERDFKGSAETVVFDRDLVLGLRATATASATTVSNVVLALFKLLLFQLTGQEDICVGMTVANRNHPDLENLIGFFVNIVVIRTRLSESMEFDELLTEVAQTTYDAFEHQDLPFNLLIQALNPSRYLNRQPMVNVVYGFQTFSDLQVEVGPSHGRQERSAPELPAQADPESFDFSIQTSKFDLTLMVSEEADTLHLAMEYDTGLFYAGTIRRYLTMMQRSARMVASEAREKSNEARRL